MLKSSLCLILVGFAIYVNGPKEDDTETAQDQLQGSWATVSAVVGVRERKPAEGRILTFQGNKYEGKGDGYQTHAGSYLVHYNTPTSGWIDLHRSEGGDKKTIRVLFQIKGDSLLIASREEDNQIRPRDFNEEGLMIFMLKRRK